MSQEVNLRDVATSSEFGRSRKEQSLRGIDSFGSTDGSVGTNYFLVQSGAGGMYCSCGRPVEKLASGAYRCTGGYPTYKPSNGEVLVDKFGNTYFKNLPHQKLRRKKK